MKKQFRIFQTILLAVVICQPLISSAVKYTFQQGINGYNGTFDTHLREVQPNNVSGHYDLVFTDGRAANPQYSHQYACHALLRFDLFGDGPDQIPLGSQILSATLRLTTGSNDRGAQGDGGTFHRMLMPWHESATWNSFGNGIQANGNEAVQEPSASAGHYPEGQLLWAGDVSMDVTADLAAWSSGAPNYGWSILPWPNRENGWGFWSSEYSAANKRPRLTVEWVPDVLYVDVNNPTPKAPYTTWSTAANNIQAAVNAAGSNSTVIVADGTYNITAQVSIRKCLTLRSLNGPDGTIVDAGGKCRVLALNSNRGKISIHGLTVTGGYTVQSGAGINAVGSEPIEVWNCIIRDNVAGISGGGMIRGTVRNSVISGNECKGWSGGGLFRSTAINCTITGNRAGSIGSGLGKGSAYNCIVWHNYGNEAYDVSMFNTCSEEAVHGKDGNITNAPVLTSSSHISPDSPCRGSGDASFAAGSDLDGDGWQSPPSMGCDEVDLSGSPSGTLAVAIKEESAGVATGRSLPLCGAIQGASKHHIWSFGDGTYETNNLTPRHIWQTAGIYEITLTAYNDSNPGGVADVRNVLVVDPVDAPEMHVLPTGLDSNDGLDWTSAKRTIQAGVDAQLLEGGKVWVGPGIYHVTNLIQIGRGLVVEGIDGPEATVVDGGGLTRCFKLYGWSRLTGFSVRNGTGAIGCGYEDAIVENCILYNNTKGIWGGFIYDCIISNNFHKGFGGGTDDATVYNTVVVNNTARQGGGIDLTFNGTGKPSGAAYNCIVRGNAATEFGGGIVGGTAYNCVVENNFATNGGGVADTMAVNCTIVENSAAQSGGGSYQSNPDFDVADLNSIVYGNTAPLYPNIQNTAAAMNTCSPDLTPGVNGNINEEPLFADPVNNNYRLFLISPCIDKGFNDFMPLETDLDGTQRFVDGDFDGNSTTDMGAYEYHGSGSILDVEIDIKPGSETNPVNLKSGGKIPVAIFGSDEIDAPAINAGSVLLAGSPAVHSALDDLNADGIPDLILHFRIPDLNLTAESTEAVLMGQTHAGEFLIGSDAVHIVPPRK